MKLDVGGTSSILALVGTHLNSGQYPVYNTESDTRGLIHYVIPGSWYSVPYIGLDTRFDTRGTILRLIFGA